ncbi:hypothetical protein LXL04_035250 [Taraxacum kok-saghyz]
MEPGTGPLLDLTILHDLASLLDYVDALQLCIDLSEKMYINCAETNNNRSDSFFLRDNGLYRENIMPCIPKFPLTELIGGHIPYVGRIRNFQVVICFKLLHVISDPDAGKGIGGVAKEVSERQRDCRGPEDLIYQAAASHAELEGGHRVVVVATEVRTPLHIKADDEEVETAVVDAFDFGDPQVDEGWCARLRYNENDNYCVVIETNLCWDLLRTHIFPRTRELTQFPISPKPLFLSKNRLRNPPKPVLKQNKKLCTYAQKKSLHICKVFGKKKSFFRKNIFATGLIFERFLAPRSRFFEKEVDQVRRRFFGEKE